MNDFLAEKRAEIDKRLRELRPMHDEYLRLERAKEALDGVSDAGSSRTRGRGSRGGAHAPSRRRGRREGGRSAEVLELVRQNPGITVSELAERLGMAQKNYLYRVMSALQVEGAVEKQGRGY